MVFKRVIINVFVYIRALQRNANAFGEYLFYNTTEFIYLKNIFDIVFQFENASKTNRTELFLKVLNIKKKLIFLFLIEIIFFFF